MRKLFFVLACSLFISMLSGCVTSPVVMNKMAIEEVEDKLPQTVLLVINEELASLKHHEKQLGTTFEYDLGFYLKNAIHDSLSSIFESVAQSENTNTSDNFDVVITPSVLSFSAPVPALVLMHTKTTVTIQYEITRASPYKPYFIEATGTYELKSDEDKAIYNSLKSGSIYTYNAATNFGMAVPDYSFEAGKDVYMAIYHALNELNAQLLAKI
ncbi:hypothetical protein Q4561_18575 [Alteromonas sp. 1_MG-2023]|uniref:hypothetical protein n=1 Tax=Alteromonas sp. 1_MG-2023 TaxID=3062669 RepID=UPI0026E39232|nr:hypothetical protein [Alteromonas sp. 1_MG-2023]MDO6569084.1 hypothetical protein [Alteromonas sp. 1_MG-2023]